MLQSRAKKKTFSLSSLWLRSGIIKTSAWAQKKTAKPLLVPKRMEASPESKFLAKLFESNENFRNQIRRV